MGWRSLGLVAAVLALLNGPQVAWGDQRDGRLDGLFERLQATADGTEAGRLEDRIWEIWAESRNAVVNRLMRQGTMALATGDLSVALSRFDQLVALAPDFAEGWNKRATVHYLMGDFEASVYDIRRTLDLEPRHFGALSGLGLIYDALDQPAAALRSFEAALKINPHLEGTRARIDALRGRIEGRQT